MTLLPECLDVLFLLCLAPLQYLHQEFIVALEPWQFLHIKRFDHKPRNHEKEKQKQKKKTDFKKNF